MGLINRIADWFRSLENPNTTLADPDPWLFDAWGGGPSSSGIRVNRETALMSSAVWRAVSLISRDVGKLPLHVYQRMPDGGRERAIRHPAYRLLRRMPHPSDYLTAFQFRQQITAHALLTGNGYAAIVRDGSGSPSFLRPLSPDLTYPIRTNGALEYKTRINDVDIFLQPADVLHVKGLGFDGMSGYSVVAMARESLGLGLAQQKYSAIYFKNSARPTMVIRHPGVLSPEAQENFLASWNRGHAGLDNAHKSALLMEGAEVQPITINAKDSQLMESREFGLRDVANWFSVPPHKLGDTARTSYSSLEQENQSYLDQGLDQWLVAWEEECNAKLISDRQRAGDSFYCEFDRNALVRADVPTRFNAYNTALQGGWVSRNEIRAKENMNPIPGGDEFLVPLNMGNTAQMEADPEDETPDMDEDDEAMRALYTDCGRRFAKRLFMRATRAAKSRDQFQGFLEKLPSMPVTGMEDFAAAFRVAGGDWRARAREAAEAVCAVVLDELRAHVQPAGDDVAGQLALASREIYEAIEEHFHGTTV